jgi:long-chain acyl-CoA synthetase
VPTDVNPVAATERPVTVDPSDNVLSGLYRRAEQSPGATAVLVKRGDSFEPMSVSKLLEQVRRLGAGLVGAGVEIGDRVAIFSRARLEWALADYAIWQAGGVTVTIYETSAPDQVEWILSNSGATIAIVENDELAGVVEGVEGNVPGLRRVFVIERGGLDELEVLGMGVSDSTLDERAASIEHGNAATLVYTSGTTGRPKGCVITHLNLIWTIRQVIVTEHELVTADNRTLTFLPLAHILARVVQLTALTAGVPVAFGGGIRTLLHDLAAVKPTWLTVVPRVLEKVHDGAAQKAGSGAKGRIFEEAGKVARQMGEHMMAGTAPPLRLRIAHRAADAAVFRNIRKAVGGELRHVISGGAPLHRDLGLFFSGIGVEVLEGYGLTETTGPATVHRVGRAKPGTVGPPLPGVDVRISDCGEIELAGPLVFDGYWDNPEATADTLNENYFRTGDVGELDSDGHLVITGRIKDLIVTAGGKNIAPAAMETDIAAHRLISHAVVVGDDRPFVAALLTVDVQSLGSWAHEHGRNVSSPGNLVHELADDPELRAELQRAIDAANESVSRAESVRTFRVLATDFTVESGELTASMKVKRSVVLERHSRIVESLYERE